MLPVVLFGDEEVEEIAALVIAGHFVRIPIELRISFHLLCGLALLQRALSKLQQSNRHPNASLNVAHLISFKVTYSVQDSQL